MITVPLRACGPLNVDFNLRRCLQRLRRSATLCPITLPCFFDAMPLDCLQVVLEAGCARQWRQRGIVEDDVGGQVVFAATSAPGLG